jgi:glycosyltransferase involved in cell wall biosynthesis
VRKLRVAIYSGVIPSTTFIENLIKAVAAENVSVFLFGNHIKNPDYNNPNISTFPTPKVGWKIIPFVFFNIIFLRIKYPNRFHILNNHIESQNQTRRVRLFLWSKYLPVILNLPDIFHLQWAINCSEWLFLSERFNTKIILSLRGAQINYKPLADTELTAKYKNTFPKIDGFHAVSKDIANEAFKYGASNLTTRVIYSGIDFDKLNKYRKINIDKITDTVHIISVGRMHWKKGYHFALDALKQLIEKGVKNFHYTIIAGLNEEEILYQIEDLSLKSFVTLHKSMSQEKVFNLMRSADLFLLPSFEEGVANVVLEAMAIGVPVLSSDCGGMSEVLIHGVNGYLYSKRDQADLIHKLQGFINDSEKNINTITDNARDYVLKNHTLQGLGFNMESFYKEVASINK